MIHKIIFIFSLVTANAVNAAYPKYHEFPSTRWLRHQFLQPSFAEEDYSSANMRDSLEELQKVLLILQIKAMLSGTHVQTRTQPLEVVVNVRQPVNPTVVEGVMLERSADNAAIKASTLAIIRTIIQKQGSVRISSKVLPYAKRVCFDNVSSVATSFNPFTVEYIDSSEGYNPKKFQKTSVFTRHPANPSDVSLEILKSDVLSVQEGQKFSDIIHAIRAGVVTCENGVLTMQYHEEIETQDLMKKIEVMFRSLNN